MYPKIREKKKIDSEISFKYTTLPQQKKVLNTFFKCIFFSLSLQITSKKLVQLYLPTKVAAGMLASLLFVHTNIGQCTKHHDKRMYWTRFMVIIVTCMQIFSRQIPIQILGHILDQHINTTDNQTFLENKIDLTY